MKNSKKNNLVNGLIFGIFLFVGLFIFVLGICLFFKNNINKEDRIYINATISRIEAYYDINDELRHNVFITYSIDGKRYQKEIGTYSSNYYEGKQIEIYYDKNNPNNVRTSGNNIAYFVVCGMGVVFMIIGMSAIVSKLNKSSTKKKLLKEGKIIYAEYVDTIVNTMIELNHRNPYNILCEWTNPNDNKKYIFKSDNIWYNPQSYIEQNSIKTFKVYINPNKMKEYYVDISNVDNNIVDLT